MERVTNENELTEAAQSVKMWMWDVNAYQRASIKDMELR